VRMFGYRALFTKSKMSVKVPDPRASQRHKPLSRFVEDIVTELNSQYVPIPRYCTRRKLLIPLVDEDETKAAEQMMANMANENTDEDGDDADKRRTGKIVKVGGDDGQQYFKRIKMMYWHTDNRQRNYSSSSARSNTQPNKSVDRNDRKHTSPQRSANSFSISPKKPGQKKQEVDPRELTKVSRIGVVRFVNPKQAQVPAAQKEPSPKKRGSTSRLSEMRESKTNEEKPDVEKEPPKKEEVKLPEIVY
jgi:hypothetical protein